MSNENKQEDADFFRVKDRHEQGKTIQAENRAGLHGWVCPKCGRVYSPFTSMCHYCVGEVNVVRSNKQ